MAKWLLALGVLLSAFGCKTLVIKRGGDVEGPRKLVLPIAVLEKALVFSETYQDEILDEGGGATIDLEELIDLDMNVDLRTLAKAFRDNADQMRFDMEYDGQKISAERQGRVFAVNMNAPDEDMALTLFLPMKVIDVIADHPQGAIPQKRLIKAFKKHSGVLLEIHDDYEPISISIR